MLKKERLPILFAVAALTMLAACAAPYPAANDSASSGSSVRPPAGWASSTYSGPSAIYGAVRGSVP